MSAYNQEILVIIQHLKLLVGSVRGDSLWARTLVSGKML